ncbi:MAG: ABC transporter ATP-binding protein [SAR116 cluster bacterium]|nr:ABC transporter ATP-binding protein [SAR116 cluster bacterium]MBU96258.1 ABC transporter ATP-binding protein [Rhodospirillaceae bacterium]|tara:strand:- start:283 stop:984 length:702 start_codon:yes stop_codon:yes gene_type:complete
MLKLEDVEAGYGSAQVLFGVSFSVNPGACVSLMGRNGMGKTTTVRTIMGQIKPISGTITRFGQAKNNMEPFELSRLGIGLVPEGRQIFTNLSVRENLGTFFRPARDGETIWTMDTVLDLFPRLRERISHGGANLSGGEQQMLAIGRALMTNPRLLILDEATEGLAPIIREQIWGCLTMLKNAGQSILVIDKNIHALAELANHHCILEKGRVVWQGDSTELKANPDLKSKYLGV